MEELILLAPEWLYALLILPLLYLFLRRAENVRARRLAEFGINFTPRRGLLYSVLLTFTCIALALTRPSLGFREFEITGRGRDIAVLLDVSRSMLARDVSPSRLEAARRKIFDLLTYLRNTSPGDRVAVVLFSGASYLFCPFTSDYAVVKMFAQEASPELITAQGSALQDALTTAVKGFEETKALARYILLLSDGEDLSFSIEAANKLLEQSNSKLSALGFGTPEGAPMELRGGDFIRNDQGEPVITRLSEENLRALAASSGGTYLRARVDDSDLATVLGDASSVAPTEGRSIRYRSYNEVGFWFLIPPALLLLLRVWQRKPELLFAFALLLCPRQSPAESREAYEAWQQFNQGKYEEAIEGFSNEIKVGRATPKNLLALGSSYFRAQRYDEAATTFSRLATEAKLPRDQFAGWYNLGNSHLAANRLQAAVEAYDKALSLNPNDERAKFNRNLAQQRLEEQQRSQQQSSKERSEKQEQQEQSQKADQNDEQSAQDSREDNANDSSQQQDPSTAPPPKTMPTASASPSEKPSGGTEQQEGHDNSTPSGTPSAEPSSPQSPKDSNESSAPSKDGKQQAESPPPDTSEQQQARAWLESVPDAPLLLRRKATPPHSLRGQQW